MTINREHLAGLELADQKTGGAIPILAELIAQAQAAPVAEPVEVVAIDWPEYHYEAMGCGLEDRGITDRYEAMQHGWDCAMERCAEQLPDEPLMTVGQHNRIMAAAPQHDAELVELIEELIDVDDGGLDDYWREHAGKELMDRIDAKLASLRKGEGNG